MYHTWRSLISLNAIYGRLKNCDIIHRLSRESRNQLEAERENLFSYLLTYCEAVNKIEIKTFLSYLTYDKVQ